MVATQGSFKIHSQGDDMTTETTKDEWCFILFTEVYTSSFNPTGAVEPTGNKTFAVQPVPAPDNSPPTITQPGYTVEVLATGTVDEMSEAIESKHLDLHCHSENYKDHTFDYTNVIARCLPHDEPWDYSVGGDEHDPSEDVEGGQ